MDLVYLCREGDNEELCYSLRSVAANLPHDAVWVFGGAPDWIAGVRFVPTPQDGHKSAITSLSLRIACETSEVSDPFVLMNDDFYVMKSMSTVPVLNRGPIAEVLAEYIGRQPRETYYTRGMRRTLELLQSLGYEHPLSFDLHMPLVVHKAHMLTALDICAATGKTGLHKRSIYGAVAGLRGRRAADVKVRNVGEPIPDGQFLSSMDQVFGVVKPLLSERFPEPCRYEAPAEAMTTLRYPVRLAHDCELAHVHYCAGQSVGRAVALALKEAGQLTDGRIV